MKALLTEQRRLSDEFRSAETKAIAFKNLLSRSGLTAPSRARVEAMLEASNSELVRLGQRRLELEASVSSPTSE
jgi:hypothetical protein